MGKRRDSMSAFLGKIHYWLYHKILVHEKLLEEILKAAEEKGVPVELIKAELVNSYGEPETRPLEEIINHGNIHGWLQERILSIEDRIAIVVTKLTRQNGVKIEDLAKIYFLDGSNSMKSLAQEVLNPEEIFTHIFNFMLEGMPCDRVNQVISSSSDEFSWQTTECLHRGHWDSASGDVANFYILRDAWINGFVSAIAGKYSYTRTSTGLNTIRKG